MKVYISGKITGLFNYAENFREVEAQLKADRHVVLTPLMTPLGLEYDDYMKLAYAMIDVADAVIMLDNWTESKGAMLEYDYAKEWGKPIYNQRGRLVSKPE